MDVYCSVSITMLMTMMTAIMRAQVHIQTHAHAYEGTVRMRTKHGMTQNKQPGRQARPGVQGVFQASIVSRARARAECCTHHAAALMTAVARWRCLAMLCVLLLLAMMPMMTTIMTMTSLQARSNVVA